MEPATVGMTLTTKIILGVVGLVVVGGIGYSVATNDGSSSMTSDSGDVFSGNVFGLMQRGGDWKCTWSGNQDGVSIEGVVYVSGDRFKSESTMVTSGMNVSAQAVSDGEFIYAWSNEAPMGVKFPLAEAESMAADVEASADVDAAVEAQQFAEDYDYACERWNADADVFAVPSNISFSDFSTMMQNAFDMMNSGGSANVDIEALMQQYQTQ